MGILKKEDISVWTEAINNVVCMDALDLLKMIPDKSIDLVLTDPPYGICYQSNMRTVSEKFNKIENDNNESRFIVYKEFYRVLKDNTVAVIFCSFKNYAYDYIELEKHFNIKNAIIWHKPGGGIGDLKHSLLTDYEIAIICHKGLREFNGKRIGSVWKISKVNPNKMVHPTEKPDDLMNRFVEYFSNKNEIVLDTYSGSFAHVVSAQRMGRNFIGCELDEDYCKIGEDRLRQKTLF